MSALADSPGLPAAEIQIRSGVAKSTISFYLGRPIEHRIVESRSGEGLRRMRLTQAERIRSLLHTYPASCQDRIVDRFVDSFSEPMH